ncbi:MAG: helix-turn-helix domain-containing protein [Spirochaetaceae bacterium]|jgi:predicted transcriptional regulator|nr:helix-turn-helix domain-containing protein [Spirochaetaceae bacterium]
MNQNIYFATFEDISLIARALDSPVRCEILRLLSDSSLNISQLQTLLQIPQSTCTTNIQILERANLIETKLVPASPRGVQKICSLKYGKALLPLFPSHTDVKGVNAIETDMPIGLFTDAMVNPPCGLNSAKSVIGFYDNVSSFLSPERASAGLIWFSYGFLDYRFPKNFSPDAKITKLIFSAELCSEYPGHNDQWPSDITLWINGIEIGTWTSPGDLGGRKGKLTPSWWDLNSTQYGYLTTWIIDAAGSWIDHKKISSTTIEDLSIHTFEYMAVRIGVKENAIHRGGVNIFGKNFGNYEQELKLIVHVQ